MNRDADHQQSGATLALVLFKAGQHQFGVEAASVRGSGGTAGDGIPSVESLLSLSGCILQGCRQNLIIKGDHQDYPLSVAAPVELCSIPAAAVHPLPLAITARCRLPGLRALAMPDHTLLLLIDLRGLLETGPATDLHQHR